MCMFKRPDDYSWERVKIAANTLFNEFLAFNQCDDYVADCCNNNLPGAMRIILEYAGVYPPSELRTMTELHYLKCAYEQLQSEAKIG